MTLRVPKVLNTAVISDNPYLAARLSSAIARQFHYLAVMDGPRLARSDASAEALRRNNALARVKADNVVLSGLSDAQVTAMTDLLPSKVGRLCGDSDVESFALKSALGNERLIWGLENIGVGLLQALYEGRLIEFEDGGLTTASVVGKSRHHVVCEAGEKLSEVIAANYAYSLGASLTIIPKVDAKAGEQILERFYASENGQQRLDLQDELRDLCSNIGLTERASVTFFTKQLPFGIGFPGHPSTHIFTYPDCGVSVVNGFAAEQTRSRGVNVAVLVDPEKTPAPEIDAAPRHYQKSAFLCALIVEKQQRSAQSRIWSITIHMICWCLQRIAEMRLAGDGHMSFGTARGSTVS